MSLSQLGLFLRPPRPATVNMELEPIPILDCLSDDRLLALPNPPIDKSSSSSASDPEVRLSILFQPYKVTNINID